MNTTLRIFSKHGTLCLGLLAGALMMSLGCPGDEDGACTNDLDCPGDQVCQQSECVLPDEGNEPTCTDGMQNGSETGVDCGGSCSACAAASPTCTDGVQNGSEDGVDCGGSCSACASGSSCFDNVQNGDETGVDCGGSSCSRCATMTASCFDDMQNGDETGVDCGGSCFPCDTAPTCTDGMQNGGEAGVDCGGPCAQGCPQSGSCSGTLRCEDTVRVCGQIAGCTAESSGMCVTSDKPADFCDRYTEESSCDNGGIDCYWDNGTSSCEDTCGLLADDRDECTPDTGCRWASTSMCTGTPSMSCEDIQDQALCEQAGCVFE